MCVCVCVCVCVYCASSTVSVCTCWHTTVLRNDLFAEQAMCKEILLSSCLLSQQNVSLNCVRTSAD